MGEVAVEIQAEEGVGPAADRAAQGVDAPKCEDAQGKAVDQTAEQLPAQAEEPAPGTAAPRSRRRVPAAVPRLEPRFRSPRRLRQSRSEGYHSFGLEVDARLALRARIETRVERARAALARRLLESKIHEAAGYSRFHDYAREELGCSLRSLQDLARIDRALEKLPGFDQEVRSGQMTLSRVLAVLPMVTPESEQFWLVQARKQTHRELVRRVRIARETLAVPEPARAGGAGVGAEAKAGTSAAGGDQEQEGREQGDTLLLQRKPPRSQLLWEAFVEETSCQAGRNVSQGEALEILLAEFWSLVPQEALDILPRRIQQPRSVRPTAAQPGVISYGTPAGLAEDTLCDQDLDPGREPDNEPSGGPDHEAAAGRPPDRAGAKRAIPGRTVPDWHRWRGPDGQPIAQHQTDGRTFVMSFLSLRTQWYRKLAARYEEIHAPWTELQKNAAGHLQGLQASGRLHDLPERALQLLEPADLDALDAEELERRFLELRAYQRRLSADEGALLFLARTFRLHRGLGFASFGHYTRERLGLTRRTADHRADFHQVLTREPVLRHAYCRDQFSESLLFLFRRLIGMGIRGKNLRPWTRRARQVPAPTFRDMVRWIEARREAWWRGSSGREGAGGSSVPAAADTAGSSVEAAASRAGSAVSTAAPCPVLPPTYREWIHARELLNASPEALAYVAMGCEGNEQMSARAGEAAPPADAINPLFPSIEEPAGRTCRLQASGEVVDSYLKAIEAIRVIYGDNKPAWWCQEIMMLYVRRDWARESRYCRRNVENYDLFERDGFRCCCPGCTRRAKLHGHHIEYRSRGGGNHLSNLITMCSGCHNFGLHRAGIIRVKGRAPHRLIWELGITRDENGKTRPRRRFLGEFRRDGK